MRAYTEPSVKEKEEAGRWDRMLNQYYSGKHQYYSGKHQYYSGNHQYYSGKHTIVASSPLISTRVEN